MYKEQTDSPLPDCVMAGGAYPPLLEAKSQCVKAPGLFSGFVLFVVIKA